MTKKDRLQFLLQRFNNGAATLAEVAELEQLLNDPEATVLLNELWENTPDNARFFDEGATDAMLANIKARNRTNRKPVIYSIAATVLLLITFTALYLNRPSTKPPIPTTTKTTLKPILPGTDRALLVLADGSTITLDSMGNATIPTQGNTQIAKTNGQLIYTSSDSATILYNLLKTPKGAQYQIQLADGSKVWMNANSALHFPTAFNGKERVVELTGEAYFEVAKDAKRPFRVKVNDLHVNVLGTHFNVMAYDNEEAAAVTLLEGTVRINERITMRPGQQVLAAGDKLTIHNNVDLEEAVAWKNGYFASNNTSLAVLMRQIERWYNVEVVYEGKIPNRKFGGKIPRKSKLDEVLKVLQISNVHTKTDGNKITIMDR